MIAAEAGLSEGLIFTYFETKDLLFIRLVEWAIDEAANVIKLVYELPGSPIEKLRSMTEEILDTANHRGRLGFLLMHQAMTGEGRAVIRRRTGGRRFRRRQSSGIGFRIFKGIFRSYDGQFRRSRRIPSAQR